ncbi:MAG: HisA/HisF-related TIM barrel protein [Acidobacteriota bacterium]
MELIPAIDLREGSVVRLAQGDDARRTVYDLEPLDLVRRFTDAGVRRIHVVDLDAAFGLEPQRRLVERLVAYSEPKIELGGGLRDAESVRWALAAGCDRLVLGSIVAKDFDTFASLVDRFPGRLVPAIEVADGKLRVSGWTESVDLGLDTLCERLRGLDCPAALVTDVSRDGLLGGPNFDLATHVAEASGIPAIVSGGVRDLDDLVAAGSRSNLAGIIVGKAYYEGHFTMREALTALDRGTTDPQGAS